MNVAVYVDAVEEAMFKFRNVVTITEMEDKVILQFESNPTLKSYVVGKKTLRKLEVT